MTEYGNAIVGQFGEELTDHEKNIVQRMLRHNFERSKQEAQERGEKWPADYKRKDGPRTQAYESLECPQCNAAEEGCVKCDHTGYVRGDLIPGRYDYTFGWYIDTDG